MDSAAKALPPGTLVVARDAGGEKLAVGNFNPHSLIAFRTLSRAPDTAIDRAFLAARLTAARDLRDLLFDAPYYRLVHAEADGLPGLVVDRYGDVLSVQIGSAGMELLLDDLVEALKEVVQPRAIVLKNHAPVRKLEGLELYDRMALGELEGPVEVVENGSRFLADIAAGQKTGWFFDQRVNRAQVATLARGRTMADFYSYAGGFAVMAMKSGATSAVAIDRSQIALDLAAGAARLNDVVVETAEADVFAEMERLAAARQQFGLVVADPPAFVKSRKELGAGAKGYRKLARLSAALVEPGGFLFIASCSHHVGPELFAEEVRHGIATAGRSGRVLRTGAAGPDHPVHPFLPESAYLKSLTLQLD
jgi:23S rRNA (cytosine1962-C5)-methyltransferase